jgi:GT2 family glycosyltransferase
MRKITVVIPLYKSAHLVPALFHSLQNAAEELAGIGATVLLINDSPSDAPLCAALADRLPGLEKAIGAELWINDANLGFVRTCNRAFTQAIADGSDVILLNSDALITPGALAEITRVAALDPMIGFVSPRSNNATICNSPYPNRFRKLDFAGAVAAHAAIQGLLPAVTYVPTAVGFCLYVKNLMLKEFGVFDTIYGGGYDEENDLIMRANRRGYRAALANHAFVYHIGGESFAASGTPTAKRQAVNRGIMLKRYPENEHVVARYFRSIPFRAQSLIAGFVPDDTGRTRILFDCGFVAAHHAGTFEFAIRTIAAFVEAYGHRYSVYVRGNPHALMFHGFEKIEGLNFCLGSGHHLAPFLAVIRLAQPFALTHLFESAELAPITGYVILDTIVLDCQYLDNHDVGQVWQNMAQAASIVGYISAYSQDQFRRRFAIPSPVVEFVGLLSTDPDEYFSSVPEVEETDADVSQPNLTNYVLIVGNHYAHKHLEATVKAFRERDDQINLIVLGLACPEGRGIKGYPAGELSPELVDDLYAGADMVVFPTHYEGFGLPAVHALARRKPLITRQMPVLEEIKACSQDHANIHMFATTEEMVEFALSKPSWIDRSGADVTPQRWSDVAAALEGALTEAVQRFDYVDLERRLLIADSCQAMGPRIVPSTLVASDAIALVANRVGARLDRAMRFFLRLPFVRRTAGFVWAHRRGLRRLP